MDEAIVQTKKIKTMHVASATFFIDKYSEEIVESIANRFEKQLQDAQVRISPSSKFFTEFHVTGYYDESYNVELWQEVSKITEDTNDITFKTIAGDEVAYIIVDASAEELEKYYLMLYLFVAEKNPQAMVGYPRETYHYSDDAHRGFYTEIQLPFE